MTRMANIADTLLAQDSRPGALRAALAAFSQDCSRVSGIAPDPGFDAWAGDTLLPSGVAINPRAAAHCVTDYRRSVVFIRALYAGLRAAQRRFGGTPIHVLYAGCGPYATLLLPLLHRFEPGALELTLLDIHQPSLNSVRRLLAHHGLGAHRVSTVRADACSYRHPRPLHLVIAETMQKALEQEPQFAVTANLAPQLHPGGCFLPERIDVELCLLEQRAARDLPAGGRALSLGRVLRLQPDRAPGQLRRALASPHPAGPQVESVRITIPSLPDLQQRIPMLLTHIQVFAGHHLSPGEADITLPRACPELSPPQAGSAYQISYHLGSYPVFELAPA